MSQNSIDEHHSRRCPVPNAINQASIQIDSDLASSGVGREGSILKTIRIQPATKPVMQTHTKPQCRKQASKMALRFLLRIRHNSPIRVVHVRMPSPCESICPCHQVRGYRSNSGKPGPKLCPLKETPPHAAKHLFFLFLCSACHGH